MKDHHVSTIKSVAFLGVESIEVDIQVQVSSGLPAFHVVGLPDKAVAESRDRIRSAIQSFGLSLPPKRIIVNLSPAHMMKEGSHFDLPIALGILVAMGTISQESIKDYIVIGELTLDGHIRPIPGTLPAALTACQSSKHLVCPKGSSKEAVWVKGLHIIAPNTLMEIIQHFNGKCLLSSPELPTIKTDHLHGTLDFQEVKGHKMAKRALEIAAAGGHNILLKGPPGSGKSMLASRMISIMPALDGEEILEVSMIQSILGHMNTDSGLMHKRPYREPHHSASLPSLVGGGSKAKPGEITLAHRGVLFLDELPEFSRASLEALRQPLETGKITVSRANAHITYPASFLLIAAMNPCRCGYLSDPSRACRRAPLCGQDYQSKISGPMMDRFDLSVFVDEVSVEDLGKPMDGDSSEKIRKRVEIAWRLQKERFKHMKVSLGERLNAHASGKILEDMSPMTQKAKDMLERGMEKWRFSARGYHRLLKVSRTIADLENAETINDYHIAEALSFKDRA